jgi:hypothetical protein
MAEVSTKEDFREERDAIVEAMLRAVKRGGYRAVVRQIKEFRARLDTADGAGKRALQMVIDKLEEVRGTMTPPPGYQPDNEG